MAQNCFSRLPSELVYMIAAYLDLNIKDLCSFARSSRWLQRFLKPVVWSSAASHRHRSKGSVVHWAAQRGRTELIAVLLDYGAQLSSQGHERQTPLHLAARYGHMHTISFLLEKGAEIDARDLRNRTPLLRASQHRHDAAVRLLMQNGADVNAEDLFCRTALIFAAGYGAEIQVRELLDAGARDSDIGTIVVHLDDDEEEDGRWKYETALERAARCGHDGIVRAILTHNLSRARALYGPFQSALHNAATKGYIKVAKTLIDHGADTDDTDDELKTPIQLAIKGGHLPMVKLLVEAGADPDRHCRNSPRPIHYAIQTHNYDIVNYLLEVGMSV